MLVLALGFARSIFLLAGVAGVVALVWMYFDESGITLGYFRPVDHPVLFYSFLVVALLWQVAFLVVASDPWRFRVLMVPSVIQKLTFAAGMIALYFGGRVGQRMLIAGAVDLVFAVVFMVAFVKLRQPPVVVKLPQHVDARRVRGFTVHATAPMAAPSRPSSASPPPAPASRPLGPPRSGPRPRTTDVPRAAAVAPPFSIDRTVQRS